MKGKKRMLIFLTKWFGFKNEILQLWNFFWGEQGLRREMRKEKSKWGIKSGDTERGRESLWWFFPCISLMEVQVVIIFLFWTVGVELGVRKEAFLCEQDYFLERYPKIFPGGCQAEKFCWENCVTYWSSKATD